LATTFFNQQQMFLLRDQLIMQSEKWETSRAENLQQNKVAQQVECFCISDILPP